MKWMALVNSMSLMWGFLSKIKDKKISAITLLPGSSFIKTSDGFYVSCSARDLFNRNEWNGQLIMMVLLLPQVKR